MTIELKEILYELCEQYAQHKIEMAQKGLKSAQSAANNETKSSAGDKYETGRAMMHLEQEKYTRQLGEGIRMKEQLANINCRVAYEKVQAGALVSTSNGVFLMCVSVGKLQHEGNTYFAMSMASPIAQVLNGLTVGEKAIFRGKSIEIWAIV